ncbi:MAG: hypothetical protein HKP10_09370 [Kiritimatiellales bacterium]|nr:hypothetical protein [Kiritimatiellales bacterium]
MSESEPCMCPHCGSHQLVAHQTRRRVFINHDGERIPLLSVNFSLTHPVIEEQNITFTCSCSWAGSKSDLFPET